ncbi:MAG: hypothetical protein HXX09_15235 [Bacteroidetes bacterium]|nr:hypothetical protein [Bacteroidota bacterium]
MKIIKIIILVAFLSIMTWQIIKFFLDLSNQFQVSKARLLKLHYSGILTGMGKEERGTADFRINDTWVENGSTISQHVLIGDSLIKESGSETITVYRKDKNGIWQEKVFK